MEVSPSLFDVKDVVWKNADPSFFLTDLAISGLEVTSTSCTVGVCKREGEPKNNESLKSFMATSKTTLTRARPLHFCFVTWTCPNHMMAVGRAQERQEAA